MLAEVAEFWWANANRRLKDGGDVIFWDRFKDEFLKKFFHLIWGTRRK